MPDSVTKKLRLAKKLSFWGASGLGVYLLLIVIDEAAGWEGTGDNPGVWPVAFLLIGLLVALLLVVIAAILAWAIFLADRCRGTVTEPRSGRWSKIVVLDLGLIALAVLLVGDLTGFLVLIGLFCLFSLMRSIRRQRAAASPSEH